MQKARETEAERGYEEYNGVESWENGELKNKTNKILQKYIEHHKLGTFKTKRERIASIAAHISRQLPSSYQTTLAPNREIQKNIHIGHQSYTESDFDNCSEISVASSTSDEAFSDAEGDTDAGDVILAKCDSSDEGSSAEGDGEKADSSRSDTDDDIANLALLFFLW